MPLSSRPPGEAWKAIVNTYLRPEMCEYPEHGCPLATLAPELARVDRRMKPQIVAELVNYKSHMVPFMPGRRPMEKERAFFAIFSTMIGAIEIARLLPDPAIREKVLGSARDFLLRSFRCPQSLASDELPESQRHARKIICGSHL